MHVHKVSRFSWHYRLYQWWNEKSGFSSRKSDDFKENLCHYLRVVVIWAPLGWFRKGTIGHIVRPWMVFTALLSITFTQFGVTFYTRETVYIWLVIFVVFCFMAFLKLLDTYTKTTIRILTILFAPIWIPLLALVELILRLMSVLSKLIHRVVPPSYDEALTIVFLLLVLSILVILGGDKAIVLAAYIVGIIIFFITGLTLTMNLPGMIERRKMRRKESGEASSSFYQLLVAYRKTKWGSVICPFIRLTEE